MAGKQHFLHLYISAAHNWNLKDWWANEEMIRWGLWKQRKKSFLLWSWRCILMYPVYPYTFKHLPLCFCKFPSLQDFWRISSLFSLLPHGLFVCLWWTHFLLRLYLEVLCSLCCIELGMLADCFTPGQWR